MTSPALERRLGTADAVLIGLGSMLGAGVFAAFAPAARAAGGALLAGLLVAAVVAYANATSSAQLAAQYPTSGGSYVYGRERLGPTWGFLAGWSFVVGKTASCAAMALTVAAYAVPAAHAGWRRPVAVLAVLAVAAVSCLGVTRTARLTRVVVTVVLAALAVAVAVALTGPDAGTAAAAGRPAAPGGVLGVLQSAGLLFFAFAGYARIATMGEEVRDPARTIPRAIQGALALTVVIYTVVAVTLLTTLGPARLAATSAPVLDAVAATAWAGPVVRVGAAAAALGALLALVAGIGRTTLAMARTGDLPGLLADVHPRHRVPQRAVVTVAAVVCVLVLTIDLRGAIGFSSFGVLLYYLVANLSARTQDGAHRRFPRALQTLGAAGCVVLVATLPWQAVAGGLVVCGVGLAVRAVRSRRAG